MLFLGSQKYPIGDDYFKTVTENNGHFNAYTDREITNYFFDIHYFSFDTALDIFSRFFIDPLFSEDKINKEINSVNSEYEKNLIIDARKRSQVYAFIADPKDPYNRFTTGNIDTLIKSAEKNGLNLREELSKFHKKYYTSDKMKLVIYTNEELDDMEEIVIEKFSQIKPSSEFSELLKYNANPNKNETNNNNKNNLKKLIYNNFLEKEKIFSEENINSPEIYTFKSPFTKEIMGSIISFESHTIEYDMTITFIQKSLRSHEHYKTKPSLFFAFVIESKEDNSLIDILKKKNLATKLHVAAEREYDKWSDFSIDISLTKNGISNLDKVLQIVSNYLDYMRSNFINEEYFNYLKNIENLKFEEKNFLCQNLHEMVSKIGARAHHYPLSYILYENIFDGKFDKNNLEEYARNLELTNSIILIPSKTFEPNISKHDFLTPKEKSYEPWYKTHFQPFKINFEKLNVENKETKNFSPPDLYEKDRISKILNNTFKCDKKCILKLKNFSTREPDLLNKTATFELWHKEEFTLDFNKMQMEMALVYDTYKNPKEKVFLNLFQTHLKRKVKKINSKIRALSSGLSIVFDNFGIKLSFKCINDLEIQKKLFAELSSKLMSSFDLPKISEFNLILQETKDRLKKEYNAQPFAIAYDYLKDNILEDHIRIDQQLEILEYVSLDEFKEFIARFEKKLYFKFLFMGSINDQTTRMLFEPFNNLISKPVPSPPKKIFSIKDKRLNRREILKMDFGNYLLRKLYHSNKNKNNCLLKCYGVDKKSYKSEVLIKLFNGIIGNIIFRELRIKKQFGYVAKSKIEIFNNQIVIYFLYLIYYLKLVLLHLYTRIS
jgi:insulysin